MYSSGMTVLLPFLLLLTLETATSTPVHNDSAVHSTPPPSIPSILYPTFPLRPSSSTHLFPTTSPEEALVISPPRLVVRFGDPFTANCSLRTMDYALIGWDADPQVTKEIATTQHSFLVLRVDNASKWDIRATCFALSSNRPQFIRQLDTTVYKLPDRVSISYDGNSGPMTEGGRYTLRCRVQDVAPLRGLSVTFYRDGHVLGPPQMQPGPAKAPQTATFTMEVSPRWEDNGSHFWCDARLDLGPDGPQLATVKSHELPVSVYFGPHIMCPSTVRVREGDSLTCEVRGNPAPQVTWRRDGQEVSALTPLSREHAGKYTVYATGSLGTSVRVVEVVVVRDRGTSHASSSLLLVTVLFIHTGYYL